MKRIALLFAALICAQITHAGGIKKWTDSEGNVHFGDAPPPTQTTKRVQVRDPATGNGSMVKPDLLMSRKTERRKSHISDKEPDRDYGERLRYRNAAVKGEVLMGMTAKELERSQGKPAKINRSQGKWGESEQWVFERPDGTRDLIYLENGEVTARN
ncbi:DUF4124 domain-containing protein [Sedimenticola selenatireducens]|nr:DUF4124 domain-containing protein [Sedimenticola selenatireducens]